MDIEPTSILLIEDEEAHAELIRRSFESQSPNTHLEVASTLQQAWSILDRSIPQLIITDFRLPDGDGTELLKNDTVAGVSPVIILTSHGDEQVAVEAIKAGALDYVVKSNTTLSTMPRIADRILREWQNIKIRERTEEELRLSEARLHDAQKIAHIGNWDWNLSNNELYCSDEIYRILGIPNTYFSNGFEDILKFVHEDDKESVNSAINSAMDQHIPFFVEYRILQPDGLERVVQTQAKINTDDNGTPNHITGVIQDVTRTHETFKQLHLLAAALEASADSIIITDRYGTIVWANPAMSRLTGFKYSELIGKNPRIWRSGNQNENFYGDMWQTILTGRSWHGELYNRKKSGEEYLEEQTITSVLNEHGEISHFVSIKRDISERKETEARNLQAAQVFEHSIEGIVITDTENKIIRINPAFTRITGYTEAEVLGKSPNILRSGRHDQTFYDQMWKELNTNGVWQGEIWNRRKNSEVYPELLTISTIKDTLGKTIEYIAVFADITERKQDEAHIHRLAFYDPLTDLPNRALIQEILKTAIDLASDDNNMVSLMSIDLDRFFSINETMGHSAGDKLLQIIARRIIRCNGESDTTARMGGDEFSIVQTNVANPGEIAKSAQNILDAIAEPVMLDNQEVFLTASIGIAMYPNDGDDIQHIFRGAETARSHAKQEGNTYQFFSEEMNAQSFEQLAMKSSLRRALERNEFILYYQPQVNIETGKVVGAESLIRWQHPDLGLVPPIKFIPLLEETGLIMDVGQWVLQTACQQNKTWQDNGYDPIHIAVNLSPRQFRQHNLTQIINDTINTTGLNPAWLDLEVTESSIMHNPEKVTTILSELHEMGIRLSIDDFGTGYSSLSYLKHFPIDVLKIDQSFIRDITNDADDETIVKAIIAMGHSLNLHVIAEGVEQQSQLDRLKDFKCEWCQGYFYSKPVPAEEFEQFLVNNQSAF